MYKCSECGLEYDIKPEYCDCGNDTFEEIKPKIEVQKNDTPPKTSVKIQNIKPKVQTPPPTKHITKKQNNFDFISLGIFLFCIVLSLVIVLFVGNPKEENVVKETKEEAAPEQNIPPISSFWNNSTVGIVLDKETETTQNTEQKNTNATIQEPQPKVIVQPQIVYVHDAPAPAQTSKTVTKQVQNNTAKQTTKPTVTQNSKPTVTTKPATSTTKTNTSTQTNNTNPFGALTSKIQNNITYNNNNPTKTNNTPATNTVANQTTTNKPATQTVQNNTSTVQKTTVQAPQPTATTVPQVDPAVAKKELANYKISLRNTIGKKIDFAKVVGDGDCAITFKINSSGKLTNRAFAKQSSNITLNDAVYAAMMSTPSFSVPPSAYNNETLRLNVKFYNGNFEINLN